MLEAYFLNILLCYFSFSSACLCYSKSNKCKQK